MSQSLDFERLYKQLQPELVGFASYFVGKEGDAVEIVNDVFMSLWEKRASFVFDTNLKSYLYKAVKNSSLNFIKKKRLDVIAMNDEGLTIPGSDVSSLIEQKENVNHVHAVLKLLPPKCQQVFLLSRVGAFSNAEIAGLLDVSVKTVENQMTKALKIFRENLKLE